MRHLTYIQKSFTMASNHVSDALKDLTHSLLDPTSYFRPQASGTYVLISQDSQQL